MSEGPRVVIELEVMPDELYSGVPGIVRVRHLLKIAGRRLGLRCKSIRSVLDLPGALDDRSTMESEESHAEASK